jgi:hypothetical protein
MRKNWPLHALQCRVFLLLCWCTCAITEVHVGVVWKPNTKVVANPTTGAGAAASDALAWLPLGSVVLWDAPTANATSMLRLTHPYAGYVAAAAVHPVQPSDRWPVAALPLYTALPTTYTAGPAVLASRKLSLAWIDQWPVGTGAVGALVGGDASEEMRCHHPFCLCLFYIRDRVAGNTRKNDHF